VAGLGREASGRQIVRLIDEHGRIIRLDPRLASARQVNVFNREERALTQGDRIQWRLVNRDLDLKNAERGTVERLDGAIATIRWDKGPRVQQIDLSKHKTWDHGYAETVYSAQSKTYDRVYVLAPIGSGLVNGQNYYTAITRARYGVKLWTENPARLAEKLERNSGEKTSSLEGLGRLDRDRVSALAQRHTARMRSARDDQARERQEHRDRGLQHQLAFQSKPSGFADHVAERALSLAQHLDRILDQARSNVASVDPVLPRSSEPHDRKVDSQAPAKSSDIARGLER
jgi:hypothetical protein